MGLHLQDKLSLLGGERTVALHYLSSDVLLGVRWWSSQGLNETNMKAITPPQPPTHLYKTRIYIRQSRMLFFLVCVLYCAQKMFHSDTNGPLKAMFDWIYCLYILSLIYTGSLWCNVMFWFSSFVRFICSSDAAQTRKKQLKCVCDETEFCFQSRQNTSEPPDSVDLKRIDRVMWAPSESHHVTAHTLNKITGADWLQTCVCDCLEWNALLVCIGVNMSVVRGSDEDAPITHEAVVKVHVSVWEGRTLLVYDRRVMVNRNKQTYFNAHLYHYIYSLLLLLYWRIYVLIYVAFCIVLILVWYNFSLINCFTLACHR